MNTHDFNELKQRKTHTDKIKYLSYRFMLTTKQAYYLYKELRKGLI